MRGKYGRRRLRKEKADMAKKCDDTGECTVHPDVKYHMRVCNEFRKEWEPVLEEYIMNKKVNARLMAVFTAVLLSGGALISSFAVSAVKLKIETAKEELVSAVEKKIADKAPVKQP